MDNYKILKVSDNEFAVTAVVLFHTADRGYLELIEMGKIIKSPSSDIFNFHVAKGINGFTSQLSKEIYKWSIRNSATVFMEA